MIYCMDFSSPMGDITALSDGENITRLYLSQRAVPDTKKDLIPVFIALDRWLRIYFNGQNPDFMIPIKPQGTDFQILVWKLISNISYAQTDSYGHIAKLVAVRLGKDKMSAQAVGGAVGKNPVPIIIPCHRVIGQNNSLVGFTGGIDKKITLLNIEGIDTSKMILPRF